MAKPIRFSHKDWERLYARPGHFALLSEQEYTLAVLGDRVRNVGGWPALDEAKWVIILDD